MAESLGYRKNPTVGHLMAQLRTGVATGHKATLAILNANPDPEAFRAHPTIPMYVKGRAAAARCGRVTVSTNSGSATPGSMAKPSIASSIPVAFGAHWSSG